jgi:hypothetical protein
MAADGAGGCWVVGYVEGSAEFDGTMLTAQNATGRTRATFLAHLSSEGKWLAAKRLECNDDLEIRYVSWNNSGKVGVIGATFGTEVRFGENMGYSGSGSSALVATFDQHAEWKELNVFQPEAYSACGGVAIDEKGGVWFGLNYNKGEGIRNPNFLPKAALLHLNDELIPDFAVRGITSDGATIEDLTAKDGSGCFVLGTFREKLLNGQRKIESVGEHDVFIASASLE